MTSEPNLQHLDPGECESLLAAQEIGRLALCNGGYPEIFPVNYAFADGLVVFRTDPGLKLQLVERGWVAFEVDGLDPAAREGWSVVVRGPAHEITAYDAPRLREKVTGLALYPWAEGPKDHWVAITPSKVTGRRVRAG